MPSDARMDDGEFEKCVEFEQELTKYRSEPYPSDLIAEARRARASEVALREENDCLRAIASKIMPCHYCGLDDVSKCRSGFPGCALMDDRLGGDECANEVVRGLRAENERLVAQLADTHREDVYKNRARHIVAWLKAQANAEGKLARQGKPTNLVSARTIFTEAHNVALSIFEGKHDTPLAAPETRGEGE